MASTAVDNHPQSFTCKCLNVRLRITPAGDAPPESSDDATFSKMHVADDGILVAHPQLTLRVKSRGITIPGTNKCSRYTTLACLICDLTVYRVHQMISSEVEANDLPLLPSDDYTEQEIMKSPNGWIEVHKDCLSGDAITKTESSDEYSGIYSLILPHVPETPVSPTTRISPDSTASSTPIPVIPTSYLKSLPPLFRPPPFTPSHSAFLHLVSVAESESQSLRATADAELARIVRAKAAEVQAREAELKVEVEQLWLKFRDGLEKLQHDRPHAPPLTVPWSSTTRTTDLRNNGQRGPVAIRDFVPVSVTPPARSTPPPLRVSALSASLAHSSIHQVMADRNNHQRSTPSNSSERSGSTHSGSPTLVQAPTNDREATSVLQFRRNVDDTINTAASHRYFLNIEEEMAKHRKEREQEEGPVHDEAMGMPGPSKPPVNGSNQEAPGAAGSGTHVNGNSKEKEKEKEKGKEKEKEEKEPRNKSKHVHFNVQPVGKGSKETNPRKAQKLNKPEEMIFPLDDNIEGEGRPSEVQASLPLLEQPSIPPRGRRIRPQPTAGLPASFSALRPASLPAPSQMRSARSPSNDKYSNNIMLSLPRSPELVSKTTNGENKDKEDTTDQETSEDTTDSSPRPTSESDSDSEDNVEEYHYHSRYGIPGSLPVNIVSSIRPREVLSLASYQPKTSVTERQQVVSTAPAVSAVRPKKMSTSAIRKATYAERDRTRSLDPGNLDFVAEEDEGEEEGRGNGEPLAQSVESGERARKHALRILQARAEVPAEGMWRSLAS